MGSTTGRLTGFFLKTQNLQIVTQTKSSHSFASFFLQFDLEIVCFAGFSTHLNTVGFLDGEHLAVLLGCCNGHHFVLCVWVVFVWGEQQKFTQSVGKNTQNTICLCAWLRFSCLICNKHSKCVDTFTAYWRSGWVVLFFKKIAPGTELFASRIELDKNSRLSNSRRDIQMVDRLNFSWILSRTRN